MLSHQVQEQVGNNFLSTDLDISKINEKVVEVISNFEMSRVELEFFQTGAAELSSQQEAVGKADSVGLCVWWVLEGGFYGYCIILSSWELVLICCFLLWGKRWARIEEIMLSSQNDCVLLCALDEKENSTGLRQIFPLISLPFM